MEKQQLAGVLKEAEPGVYTIFATTDDVDRDGDVVVPGGITNLDSYLTNNPVILFGHDYRRPPVGKAVTGRLKDNAVELDIEFADTEFGREVKYLYDNGFMNSFSIGFIPQEHKIIGDQWFWTKWELLEVSAVPVPANAAANMVRALGQKGIDLPKLRELYLDQATSAEQGVEVVDTKTPARGFLAVYNNLLKQGVSQWTK